MISQVRGKFIIIVLMMLESLLQTLTAMSFYRLSKIPSNKEIIQIITNLFLILFYQFLNGLISNYITYKI